MKPLIAILSCHKLLDLQQACRDTWLRGQPGRIDYRFFLGGEPVGREPQPDEVFLPCADGYHDLPIKLYHTLRWALEHQYTNVFKCDDDTYVHIPRLMASGFQQHDFTGTRRSFFFAAGGPGYWLSTHSMQVLTKVPEAEWASKQLEDSTVGLYLVMDQKAPLHNDKRYMHGDRYPMPDNDLITAHKCDPARMRQIDTQFTY